MSANGAAYPSLGQLPRNAAPTAAPGKGLKARPMLSAPLHTTRPQGAHEPRRTVLISEIMLDADEIDGPWTVFQPFTSIKGD